MKRAFGRLNERFDVVVKDRKVRLQRKNKPTKVGCLKNESLRLESLKKNCKAKNLLRFALE